MKKRKICFFTLVFVLPIFIYIFSCKSPSKPENVVLYVDKESVADGFGDHNGTASEKELEFIDNYLISNNEAWGIGAFPLSYRNSTAVPADTVLKVFKSANLWGPYESEYDLRREFVGMSFSTPNVGVYVIRYSKEYYIYKFFHSPGPRISLSQWIDIRIK
ncbi:hypothetical protein ACFL4T_13070 [candidate division KSB1 bacterium]